MKVCFRTNIGSIDMKRFEIGDDLSKCLKGAEMDVSDSTAQKLIEAKLADPVVPAGKVKAVPSVEVKT